MKKRILVTLCATLGALAAGAVPAATADTPTRAETYWVCVGVDQADLGVCQRNPLPDRLPVPDEARVLPPESR